MEGKTYSSFECFDIVAPWGTCKIVLSCGGLIPIENTTPHATVSASKAYAARCCFFSPRRKDGRSPIYRNAVLPSTLPLPLPLSLPFPFLLLNTARLSSNQPALPCLSSVVRPLPGSGNEGIHDPAPASASSPCPVVSSRPPSSWLWRVLCIIDESCIEDIDMTADDAQVSRSGCQRLLRAPSEVDGLYGPKMPELATGLGGCASFELKPLLMLLSSLPSPSLFVLLLLLLLSLSSLPTNLDVPATARGPLLWLNAIAPGRHSDDANVLPTAREPPVDRVCAMFEEGDLTTIRVSPLPMLLVGVAAAAAVVSGCCWGCGCRAWTMLDATLAAGLVPMPNISRCVTAPCSAASEVPRELVLVSVLKQLRLCCVDVFWFLRLRRRQQNNRARRNAAPQTLTNAMPPMAPLVRAEVAAVLADDVDEGDDGEDAELVLGRGPTEDDKNAVDEPSNPVNEDAVVDVTVLMGAVAVIVDNTVTALVTKTVGATVTMVCDTMSITDVTVAGLVSLFSWPVFFDGPFRVGTALLGYSSISING